LEIFHEDEFTFSKSCCFVTFWFKVSHIACNTTRMYTENQGLSAIWEFTLTFFFGISETTGI
jgi:hypothetical protein